MLIRGNLCPPKKRRRRNYLSVEFTLLQLHHLILHLSQPNFCCVVDDMGSVAGVDALDQGAVVVAVGGGNGKDDVFRTPPNPPIA